jgi:hypothetical protein
LDEQIVNTFRRKYRKCEGELLYISLNKGTNGLGISLAGHKDRRLMTVFICGLNPKGNAARDGRMMEGDIILVCHVKFDNFIKTKYFFNVLLVFRRPTGFSFTIVITSMHPQSSKTSRTQT